MIRQKANLPPGSTMHLSGRVPSELPGWDTVAVTFSNEGVVSHPIKFLLSNDGKTLAQLTSWDISANPRNLVSADDRPARGGPATAPVLIVGFDDLECPYCARLHQSIFPAITRRYGDSVRIVYKDFPLDQHPWAMRASVDVNCLGAQSTPGYWNAVDYIHAHSSEIGQPPTAAAAAKDKDAAPEGERTLERANGQLDKMVREQGAFQKVDLTKLDACIAKQDTTAVAASRKVGESLGVDSTPSLFINGDKIDGAIPLDFLFAEIDDALRAAGATPPAPYAPPAPPTPAKPVAASAPAGK
jgi:protein-disulfide isomerase